MLFLPSFRSAPSAPSTSSPPSVSPVLRGIFLCGGLVFGLFVGLFSASGSTQAWAQNVFYEQGEQEGPGGGLGGLGGLGGQGEPAPQHYPQLQAQKAPSLPAVDLLVQRAARFCAAIGDTQTPDETLYRAMLDLNAFSGENHTLAASLLTRFANEGGVLCINPRMAQALKTHNGSYGVTHPITTPSGERPAVIVAQSYNVSINGKKTPVLEISPFVSSYGASDGFKGQDRGACLLAGSIVPLLNRSQDPIPFQSGVITSFFALDAQTCIGQDEKGIVWASLATHQLVQPAFRIAAKDIRYVVPPAGASSVRVLH